MVGRAVLLDLAGRCEKATNAEYAIERDIADALDLPGIPKFYTGSLDAAMTLLPERALWRVGHVSMAWGDRPQIWASVKPVGSTQIQGNPGATPALALTAAALRARAEMEE